MIKSVSNKAMEQIDQQILEILQTNGRINNTELARRINLSPPATHKRLKRLEKTGYIRDYVALLDRERMGYDMLCFINVNLQMHQPEHVEEFRIRVLAMPQVLECYHLTGKNDYLLKVVIRNRKDLERFVVKELTPVSGIANIHTSLVLTEIKSTTVLPTGA
ncbi:Lrp/AsnC family transcriptional regulator [Anaerolineales bacterium HSG24]|nr:Lrp/AsnC family transcriptional regulator [Anaerolineales bacterium HSG24]